MLSSCSHQPVPGERFARSIGIVVELSLFVEFLCFLFFVNDLISRRPVTPHSLVSS